MKPVQPCLQTALSCVALRPPSFGIDTNKTSVQKCWPLRGETRSGFGALELCLGGRRKAETRYDEIARRSQLSCCCGVLSSQI